MRKVAIFRHNLFRVSETFITQQAQSLRRHTPLYLGRLRYGEPPAGACALAVEDLHPRWPLPAIAWQTLSRDPRPYLRLLNDHRVSLIHAHFGIEGVYALPLADRLGVPLITTFHGFDATLSTAALLSSPAWANYPLFRRRLARRGALFLCASSFIRDRVLAMGFPEARCRVHYIGVDTDRVRPRDPGEETPTILHVARLVEVKGTEFLIRAFASLPDPRPDTSLVIIGDGPRRRPLEALATALGVRDRVAFLGALPHADVLGWMRRASMLALPSVRTSTGRVEGLGMVLLEAAATGVPAIGSRIGGIPEGIADGATGLLAPERDVAALATHIATLLRHPALRARLGAEARRRVVRHFDLRQQTDVLETVYDEVIAGAASPGHTPSAGQG